MKYMMIVCYDPSLASVPDDGGMDIGTWISEMDKRGVHLEGHALLAAEEATTVRVRNGELLVSDGPFAIEVASKHPLARRGAMELRPFRADD